ncbi:MAG: OmpA family protein [Cryomorphaceae bacterium]
MKPFILFIIFSVGALAPGFAQDDTLSFASPQRLSSKVNSEAEESCPIRSTDGKTLYFVRTYHPDNTGGKFAGQGIWKSAIEGNAVTEAEKISELNDRTNNIVAGISASGERLYVLNRKGEKKTILPGVSRSTYDASGKQWSEPEGVNVPGLEAKGNFYSAYVSPDEDFILWSLPSRGMDTTNSIFVSLSKNKGETWSSPEELGGNINSALDDISPFYHEELGLLFWSTNGRDGFGDYDIYYARRLDDTWQNWSEPVNAGKGLNSSRFDAYFFVTGDGSAYFSSNRGDSLSNLYISQVKVTPIEKEVEEEEIEPVDEIAVTEVDRGEKDTKKAVKDPVLIIDTREGGSRSDRSLTDLSLEELTDSETTIRFVYFPYDKYNITAKYIEVLDDVGVLLDTYPQIDVVIDGHTDDVGSQAYNMVLSENRALSTKEYLMIHGIEQDRIRTRAYGKLRPYSTNETEDGRSLNRRVELFFKKR